MTIQELQKQNKFLLSQLIRIHSITQNANIENLSKSMGRIEFLSDPQNIFEALSQFKTNSENI